LGALGAALLALGASAATPAKAKYGPRDIFDTWIGVGGMEGAAFKNEPWPSNPEFTAWGEAASKKAASLDTQLHECFPWTPAGFMSANGLFPIQIMPARNSIVMLYEAMVSPRRIYTDGRKHPPADEMLPTFLGHSVAHWEGDTLVIDTVGMNGLQRPINGYVSGAVNSGVENNPRLVSSDQLHVVERIRLVKDGEYLEDTITVEDPKVYKKGFTARKYFQRRPELDFNEYVCDFNRRPDAEGQLDAPAQ
jgi:hypothetical protein